MTVDNKTDNVESKDVTTNDVIKYGDDVQDLETLITQLGGFSRYQIMIFLIGCLGSYVSGFAVVNIGFVGKDLDHRCFIPQCDAENTTKYNENFLNFTTPIDTKNKRWDRCDYYAPSNNSVPLSEASVYEIIGGSSRNSDVFSSGVCEDSGFSQNENKTLNCSHVVFDTSMFSSTTVTTFGLTCNRAWLQPLSGAAYMVGMLFGAIILGDLSDRVGRRWGYIISTLIALIGGLISAVSVNYPMFLFTRVLCGFGNISIFLVAFVVVLEFVPPDYRRFCGLMIEVPFALGEASVALFAYFIRDWRWLQVATTLPSAVLLVVLYFILPESIRWLVSQGKIKQAHAEVERCARMNKTIVKPEMLLILEKENPRKSTTGSTVELSEYDQNNVQADPSATPETRPEEPSGRNVLGLIKLKNMRRRTINLAFSWIIVTMSYYGLSANAANLGGNVFVNFVAIMLIEVPSYIFGYLVLDKMGRKGTMVFTFLLGGIGCLVASAYISNDDLQMVVVTASMVGKFGVSCAFAVVYIFTAEIFSTEYRTVGVGFCSMAARIGGIIAPFISDLGRDNKPVPLLIFGVLAISAGLLNILLPETAGLDLPQTVQEGEDLGSDQSILYFTCYKKKKNDTRSQGVSPQ